jgi:hypothetical protein
MEKKRKVKRNFFYKLLLFVQALKLWSKFTNARYGKKTNEEDLYSMAMDLDMIETELRESI